MKVLNSYKICLSKKTGILCGFYKFLNVLFEIAQQVKLNVTTQYLHCYNQESIPDRLRRWDFYLPDYVFLQSDDGGCFHSINTIPPHTQFPYIPLSEKTYASAKPPPRSQSGMHSSPLRNPPVPSGYSTGSDPSSGNFLFSDP